MTLEEIKRNAPEGAGGYKLYGELVIYYMFDMPHHYRFKKSTNSWVYCALIQPSGIKPL